VVLSFSKIRPDDCSEIVIQTLFMHDCSFKLFEQLLFWGPYFKFATVVKGFGYNKEDCASCKIFELYHFLFNIFNF
jgi:hypothetical protein